jgi:hypothetical protein
MPIEPREDCLVTMPDLEALRARFEGVARCVGEQLAQASERVVALVAKWSKDDLVPGLSDLDFRVVCDEDATAASLSHSVAPLSSHR